MGWMFDMLHKIHSCTQRINPGKLHFSVYDFFIFDSMWIYTHPMVELSILRTYLLAWFWNELKPKRIFFLPPTTPPARSPQQSGAAAPPWHCVPQPTFRDTLAAPIYRGSIGILAAPIYRCIEYRLLLPTYLTAIEIKTTKSKYDNCASSKARVGWNGAQDKILYCSKDKKNEKRLWTIYRVIVAQTQVFLELMSSVPHAGGLK